MIGGLEGAHAGAGNGRYLLIREFVPPAHYKHLALFFRQAGHRLGQFPLGGGAVEIGIGLYALDYQRAARSFSRRSQFRLSLVAMRHTHV